MGVTGFTGERTRSGHGLRAGTAAAIEQLEGRTLFSGAAASTSVVDVVWKGHTVKAVQDQWVVSTTNAAKFEKLATQQGFTGVSDLARGYFEFTSADSPAQMVRLAASHPVALGTVQPNMVSTIQSTLPNDADLSQQWGVDNTGQLESFDYNNNGVVTPYDEQSFKYGLPAGVTSDFPTSAGYPDENQFGTVGEDIDAQQAWDISTGSKSVVVAILDTGIDTKHPDLAGNLWTNPLDTVANGDDGDGYVGDIHGYNFIADDADVTDDNGHGTAVAGVIGASGNNGIGVTGVDWNVSLLPVKVADAEGNAPDSSVIAGINYVINLRQNGINVVVMNESFTGSTAFPVDVLETQVSRQAGKAGIVSVVSAGNSSADLDKTTGIAAQYATDVADVITVAAVDNQGKLASFSNYGSQRVDIAAPGVNIYTTLPTYTFQALEDQELEQSEVADYYLPPDMTEDYGYVNGTSNGLSSTTGGLTQSSGTSMAAPFVAGVIALEAAVNPSATPAQLKTALLESRTYDPYLAEQNGVPAKVGTSGTVNAYQALLAIQNPFVGADTTRGGSWEGYYGVGSYNIAGGAYIVGDNSTASLPAYVSLATSGGAPVIVDNSTNNVVGLQRATDPSDRLEAYMGSATTESIDLTFTDGQAHRTRLYLADYDHKKRTEVVSIVDAATGFTIDSEEVSNFTKGEYLSWDLQGKVDIVVTSISGGAVYSGLFFDAPDTKPTAFYNIDPYTAGSNWRNTYGSQGDTIFGDANTDTNPTYVSAFSVVGGTLQTVKPTTKDTRALQRNLDTTHNIEAYEATATSEDINVGISDSIVHTVSLYLADYNNQKRSERIQVIDAATGAILVTQDVSGFKAGEFVSFSVTGSVTFRITNTGGPSAVVSGIFFDAPYGEEGHFDGTDTTTGGNWTASSYGQTASFLIGASFPGINVATDPRISLTGGTEVVRASRDPAALEVNSGTTSNPRIAGYDFTTSSMTVTYTPSDTLDHQLSLYFADYENDHRVESVTVINTATGAVLDKQVVSNFRHGKYLTYDVRTPVSIVITNMGYPNAVLSGVFLD
jgi:subtilisin family serine protease